MKRNGQRESERRRCARRSLGRPHAHGKTSNSLSHRLHPLRLRLRLQFLLPSFCLFQPSIAAHPASGKHAPKFTSHPFNARFLSHLHPRRRRVWAIHPLLPPAHPCRQAPQGHLRSGHIPPATTNSCQSRTQSTRPLNQGSARSGWPQRKAGRDGWRARHRLRTSSSISTLCPHFRSGAHAVGKISMHIRRL